MRVARPPVLVLGLVLTMSACGRVERERQAAADSATAATFAQVGEILAQSTRRADRFANAADRILSPMPVMTPAEEDELRRSQNAEHVARARALGVRVLDDDMLDSLLATGRLVELEDSTDFWIVRSDTRAAVVPDVPPMLEILGQRFQEKLAELGLPPYRLEVTSALRTSQGQERLRLTNANAASGVSSHEFGTTVDLSYAAFAPPAARSDALDDDVPVELQPYLERVVDLSLESVSARKSRELGAIFSRVLNEAQLEGLVLILYERQQTVYHVTVARRLTD